VLSALATNDIYLGKDKSAFGLDEMDFLGHVVGKNGIKPDPTKVQAVKEWPVPTCQRHVRAFLGLDSDTTGVSLRVMPSWLYL